MSSLNALARSLAALLAAGAAAAALPATAGAQSLVALGDSYSSGEGAPPFVEGTGTKGGCHRSDGAWPMRVARSLGWNGRSFACSGAVIDDVLRGDFRRGLPSQVSLLAGRNTDVVTLSIGGNDVGFADILKRCLVPDSCRRAFTHTGVDLLDGRIAALEARLPALYAAVQSAAPRARLLVMDYPRLFARAPRARSCVGGGAISADDQVYLNEKLASLDAAIGRRARAAGATFVDVAEALDGHELACGVARWLNDLTPAHIVYSFHPNQAGHHRLGQVVERRVEQAASDSPGALDAASALALARRFRPVLLLDGAEPWRPLDVYRFAAERWHEVCSSPSACVPLAALRDLTSSGLTESGAIPFLRVDGRSGLGGRDFVSRDRRCGRRECGAGRIYVHVTQDPDQIYLDFWWYFRFNEAPGGEKYDHQSDWEGVVVAVDRHDTSTFAWVGFAAHDGVWRYLRNALSCDGTAVQGSCGTESGRFGRHVDVFLANGTHAAYPAPCTPGSHLPIPVAHLSCRQNAHVPNPALDALRVPEASIDGRLPWDGNDDPSAVSVLGPWAWWPGFWDPGAHVESPAEQVRFREPRRATETRCPPDACNYVAPDGFLGACGGWFGVDATATACDADLLESGAAGAGLLHLRRGLLAGPLGLGSATEELQGQDVPGLAQLLGAPMGLGESLTLDGVAGAGAELFVRVASGSTLYEARFADLGLQEGGTLTVTASPGLPGGPPRIALRRPDGSGSAADAVVARRA